MSPCKNCGAERTGRYCAACGQDGRLERLTLRAITEPALDALFSVESRLLRTVIGLTLGPGRVAAEYVEGRRASFVHPFRYYVVALAASALVASLLGFDPLEASQGLMQTSTTATEDGEFGVEAQTFLARWLGYALLLALPVLAGFLRLFFPRSGRNFTESYVLALYAVGHAQVLSILALSLQHFAPTQADSLRKVFQVVWVSWGSVVFFGAPRFTGTLRAMAALLLYLFAAVILLLGLAVLFLGGG